MGQPGGPRDFVFRTPKRAQHPGWVPSVQKSVQLRGSAAPPPYSHPANYAFRSAPQSTQIPTAPQEPAAPAAQPAAAQPLVARPVKGYGQQGAAQNGGQYIQQQYNQGPYAQPGTSQYAQQGTAPAYYPQPGAAQQAAQPDTQYLIYPPQYPMYPPVFYRTANFSKSVCLGFLVFGVFVLVLGIVLMALGGTQKTDAEGLDVGVDFTTLASQCPVRSVRHCWETLTERENKRILFKCFDKYVYTFDAPAVGRTGLKSKEEVIQRGESDCGAGCAEPGFVSSGPPTGALSVGDSVQCWQRSREDISGVYQCGNELCVKIFDPQEDIDSAVGNASMLLYSGVVLFVAAFIGCLICCALQCFCMRQAKAQDAHLPPRRFF